MKIRDITLVYSSDSAQRDGISRACSRYHVKELDGMRFLVPEDSMTGIIQKIQSSNADVMMTNIRVVYVLDTPASAQSFGQVAEQLMQIYDRGRGLFNGCSLHVIWKTDDMKMSECYQTIADPLRRLQEEEVATKLMLVSQRNSGGSILQGIDGETASILVVLTACGKLSAKHKGVFVYETKQLSILQEDIENILESQVLRQLDKLPDRVYTWDMQSSEARQYRQELWKCFFDDWSGEPVNGDRLEHIKIDSKVRSLLPSGADFCLFAPCDYGEIHRALDFFDEENSIWLLKKLPEMLVESWRSHAAAVLERAPDLYNKDVQDFFRALGEQNLDVNAGDTYWDTPASEPKPGFFENKEKFYLGKLVEQASLRLNRYSAGVRSSFLKALRKACAEMASTIIPIEIERRDQLLDAFKAGLSSERHRYVRKEELERFRAYNAEIVDDICKRIQDRINRHFMRNYAHANDKHLILHQEPEKATEAWRELIQACKNEVLRNLNIRNLIQQINSLPLEQITGDHIKTNGKLMSIGYSVSTIQTADGFCVMSSEIMNMGKQSAIVAACGVQQSAFELLDNYDNVSAVLEYQLIAQVEDVNGDSGTLPEMVLPQIVVWNYDPIGHDVALERSREREPPIVDAAEFSETKDAPQNGLEWLRIDDNRNSWTFQSEDWDSYSDSATIKVGIRALAADGITPVNRSLTFSVGRGGNSRFIVPKEGFYGVCAVSLSRNASHLGSLEIQGKRITCLYELRPTKKSVDVGSGEQLLLRYKVIIRDETGNGDLPLLQNGEMLAASYASGDSGEWKAARDCVFYVSRGNKKANELDVYIPSDREDSFRLIPAQHRDLYDLVRE